MEVIIKCNPKDEDGERKLCYDIDEDKEETVGELRGKVAADLGLYECHFRLVAVTSSDRNLLEDNELLRGLKFEKIKPPGLSEEEEEDSDDNEEGEPSAEPDEKSQSDSIEPEKKHVHNKKAKLVMKLLDEYINGTEVDKDEEESTKKTYDKKGLRQEIYMVMRMSRDELRLKMNDARIPRSQVIYIEIEESFPIHFVTANDGVKSLPCLADDTIASVRSRAANLYGLRPGQFQMRRFNETGDDVTTEPEMTLGEMGINGEDQFYAFCTGLRKIRTMFALCACLDIEVNMDKPIRRLRKRITRVAPDLMNVKFMMCYNGMSLKEIDGDEMHLGKIIMGSALLRVIIEINFNIPYEIDQGPELTFADPVDTNKKIKDRHSKGSTSQAGTTESVETRQYRTSEASEGNEGPLHFKVNKRALTHFTILIECHKFDRRDEEDENKIYPDYDNGAVYEAPITLPGLTTNTRFYELRDMIAKKTNEDVFHQILYKNGELFDFKDDYRTLEELDMVSKPGSEKCIYKEPSITVNVIYNEVTVPMTVAGKGTSFGVLADFLHYEQRDKIPLLIEEMVFQYHDVIVMHEMLFSDCQVKHEDKIVIIPPFRVRLWHNCYVYDNDLMWSHTNPNVLVEWIEKETGISPQNQVIVALRDDGHDYIVNTKHATLKDCGITPGFEIEIYEQGDLPFRLEEIQGYVDSDKKDAVSGDETPQFPGFVESHERDEDDEDDDDDDDYNPDD